MVPVYAASTLPAGRNSTVQCRVLLHILSVQERGSISLTSTAAGEGSASRPPLTPSQFALLRSDPPRSEFGVSVVLYTVIRTAFWEQRDSEDDISVIIPNIYSRSYDNPCFLTSFAVIWPFLVFRRLRDQMMNLTSGSKVRSTLNVRWSLATLSSTRRELSKPLPHQLLISARPQARISPCGNRTQIQELHPVLGATSPFQYFTIVGTRRGRFCCHTVDPHAFHLAKGKR